MTKRKLELDPGAERDFEMIYAKKRSIRSWLRFCRTTACLNIPWRCDDCRKLFPEIIGKSYGRNKCPCHLLKVRDVIKVAREAVQ